ncbi:hypothetical protein P154DRAFT_481166 [Amniculicola lignicola CBS 123094]|uniref:EthD domain-containing protein n=1 Tax=Amniculicola lignicola CBS 123094 TaxID=1392246 RepID=A0A6A5X2G5_9PLEO|nr:hypothetical protein P154DRAFT_481166 [Amniculicola lignicola CBS 123094]
MPHTLVFFMSRLPTLSHADFKHCLETQYIPLLKSIVGEEFPLSYTRHYIDYEANPHGNIKAMEEGEAAFDAIGVLTFADKAHLERFSRRAGEGDNGGRLRECKRSWMEVEAMRGWVVGETRSTGRDGKDVGWRFVGSV